MFDFSLLHMDFRVEKILQDKGLDNDRDILVFLELYKFYSRTELCDFIAKCEPDLYVADKTFVQRTTRFTEIEKKYGVLIEEQPGTDLIIYYDVAGKVSFDVLDLEFSLYNTKFCAVTPLNFICLTGDSVPRMESDIVFSRILLEALRLHATDIHFTVEHLNGEVIYPIKYRHDGLLEEMRLFTIDARLNREIISNLIERKTDGNSMDLLDIAGVTASAPNVLGDSKTELRVSANKVLHGFHYVIRIQQRSTVSLKIEQLGFHEQVLDDLYAVCKKQTGFTLITGAARTGKNTTAFAILNEIIKQPIKIVSYESPVEVLMPFPQVDFQESECKLLEAVRLAKKQDIDLTFVNEIPNGEIAVALQELVNSSIGVITTVHIDRLWHLPYKLKSYYNENYKDVISQITGIFNQKMFGVNCPHCAERRLVSTLDDEKQREFLLANNINSIVVSKGCEKCGGYGLIPGRNQPYAEHLLLTDELKSELLRCDETYEMERVLRDAVIEKQQNLEFYMLEGIKRGVLPLFALNYIL